jgi:hypothetical protein
VANKNFWWGTGYGNGMQPDASNVQFQFGDLTDDSGRWALRSAYVVLECQQVGHYAPPMVDTTWTTPKLERASGGSLGAVYQAEESDCYLELGCEGEGERGGGTGGGGGSGTCYYLVAADENGVPLLDEAGNWHILANLGCN